MQSRQNGCEQFSENAYETLVLRSKEGGGEQNGFKTQLTKQPEHRGHLETDDACEILLLYALRLYRLRFPFSLLTRLDA